MDLWIRSQDKSRLVKANDLYIIHDENNFCDYIVNALAGHTVNLAKYNKKNRALEILDDIHSCIQTNCLFDLYSKFGNFPDDFNKKTFFVPVYQMPKE